MKKYDITQKAEFRTGHEKSKADLQGFIEPYV